MPTDLLEAVAVAVQDGGRGVGQLAHDLHHLHAVTTSLIGWLRTTRLSDHQTTQQTALPVRSRRLISYFTTATPRLLTLLRLVIVRVLPSWCTEAGTCVMWWGSRRCRVWNTWPSYYD